MGTTVVNPQYQTTSMAQGVGGQAKPAEGEGVDDDEVKPHTMRRSVPQELADTIA